MQELSRTRKMITVCLSAAAVLQALTLSCSDGGGEDFGRRASNVAPPPPNNQTISMKEVLSSPQFHEYWYEISDVRTAVAKRNKALWDELAGAPVFGISVVFPAKYALQAIEVISTEGASIASWLVFEPPVSDYSAREYGQSQPGFGIEQHCPLDPSLATKGFEVYWSEYSAETPVLVVPPFSDLGVLRYSFIQLNLIDKTWSITGWPQPNH